MSLFKKKKEKTELEVSEQHVGLRIALAAGFLVLGLGAFAFFLIQLISDDPGWQTIEVSDKSFMEAGEVTLNYNLGQGDRSATEEKRVLQSDYSSALSRVYKLFDARRTHEGLINLEYINRHPGEVLTVDSDLYAAFALLEAHGSRMAYLAPVQAQYRNLFSCTDDQNAATFDPRRSEEARALTDQLVAFANHPESIRMELLGSNQLRLTVSEEYLAFAAEHEIDILVDFSWLTNAFVVDAVADELMAKGYTRGYLTSYDGYTRYLDAESNTYTIRIFDRVGKEIFPAATAECAGVKSLVNLRDYPLDTATAADYYGYADGSYASRYVGSDGLCRSALHDLTAYSKEKGCAESALTISSAFIADQWDEARLADATAKGIYTVWCVDRTIHHTAPELALKDLYDNGTVRYTVASRP